MSSCKMVVVLVSLATLSLALEQTLGQPVDKDRLINELDVSNYPACMVEVIIRCNISRLTKQEYF